MTETKSIFDYAARDVPTPRNTLRGDSTMIKHIIGKPFTITAVRDIVFEIAYGSSASNDPCGCKRPQTEPAVEITTKETFKVDGQRYKKFFTTSRHLNQLLGHNEKLRNALNKGVKLKPICIDSNFDVNQPS